MFLTAYAEWAGLPDRIWYLTNEPVPPSIAGSGDQQATVLATAAVVGDEHQSSHYRVRILLTSQPISQEHALAAAATDRKVTAAGRFDLVVTR